MSRRYLSLAEVLELHRLVVAQAGGAEGLRDLGGLESAVAQPRATFGGADLYPTLAAKAAALGHALALNHAFVDGNKRVAHAALETFLVLNGHELVASVDEAEHTMLALASGDLSREQLIAWVERHVRPLAR
ncbi:type II toxin-antitoxin system death-on-curing family toxin [Roseisolibacter agri]|uniref:Death-on-curing protein n=1 Tax=Roseisolibacter agri TaxID=2014610 RepID=A0AA37Q973_9BACT|nr:type II toxin-antitoxin system death-on-curing family toxin [Roseisolibacter agri]GLC24606.1 death-on-curing protein [Roseisolibacter agri]